MARRPRPRKRKIAPRTKLTAARETAKLTQQQLGALSACTVATISDIETGRNRQPAYTKVVRIVRALRAHGLPNITADDLFAVAQLGTAKSRRYPL